MTSGSGRPRRDIRRIALVLEYDGACYHGSQLQKRAPSIQSELEASIFSVTGERVRVAFAGRTDAGVHAIGQVAAFTTSSRYQPETFERALNARLPASIAVRRAQEVDLEFDPRRRASSRTYRYTVYNAPQRSPLSRDRVWHVPQPLDITATQRAAGILVGEHDFASFSRREPSSTIRRVFSCTVVGCPPAVHIQMTANAFLRHQVRRTVGALVEVGLGKRSVRWFQELLSNPEPATAGPVAPARGLVLVHVAYPDLDLTGEARYHESLTGLVGPALIAGTNSTS